MSAYIALLRAVNVSGKNRLSMAGLRALLEELGLRDVRTYLQSGNAVFSVPVAAADGLAADIEERLSRDLGVDTRVVLVPAETLAAVAAANPFAGLPGVDERWLHATFLCPTEAGGAGPDAEALGVATDGLGCQATEGEAARLVVVPPPVVVLKLPHGYGRTKLTNAALERALGVAATTRNWRTVLALAQMGGS